MTARKVVYPRVVPFDRYHGEVDGVQCKHVNGHITTGAAIKCMAGVATEATPATAVAFDRFNVELSAGKQCEHRFGHRTTGDAERCVKAHSPKPPRQAKVKAEPDGTVADSPAKVAAASAAARRRLTSGTEGQIARA